MLEKLAPEHKRRVKELRPLATASNEERAHAFGEMHNYLQQHAQELFDPAAWAANCLLHPGEQILQPLH
jgi:hypothetical protein